MIIVEISSGRGTPQPVEYRRLEDRIRELCTKAVDTPDPAELNALRVRPLRIGVCQSDCLWQTLLADLLIVEDNAGRLDFSDLSVAAQQNV